MQSIRSAPCGRADHLVRVPAPQPSATTRRCSAAMTQRRACLVNSSSSSSAPPSTSDPAVITTGVGQHVWTFPQPGTQGPQATSSGRRGRHQIREVAVADIRRPLGRTRANDHSKVEALMHSIQEVGLQEPIDVLEVEGNIYGFSGCHRYEAHVRLGKATILCRVRKATQEVLKMHMM